LKPKREIPVSAVVAAILAVVVAIGIFVLTEQAPDVTSAESSMVSELLVSLFGGIGFLYDPTTDLWLGISIRHWAHTAEFWAFGIFATSAAWLALKPSFGKTAAVSLAVCAAFSLFDQCHKLFVPGRHFDCFDLVMDALGYGLAILTVLLLARLISKRKA